MIEYKQEIGQFMNALPLVLLTTSFLLGSACSSESPESLVQTDATLEGTPAAANPGTDTPATETPDPSAENETGGQTGNVDSGSGSQTGEESPPVTNPVNPESAIPRISFAGTSLGAEYNIDDLIVLDASASSVEGGDIVSYQWEQIDNGKPMVSLANADTGTASFPAIAAIDGVRLNFKVAVVATNGNTGSSDFNYSWNIAVPADTGTDGPDEPAIIGNGHYILGQSGGFYAESAESVYVANQDDFRIDHINPATDTLLASYQLTAMPTLLDRVASSKSLYAGLSAASILTRLDLETGQQTDITTSGEVQSIAAHDGRLYYTVKESGYNWGLYSVGDDNLPEKHGVLEGDLILPNPVTDEIVAAWTGISPASIFRYSMGTDGSVSETQRSRDLGSNVQDLAISSDGLQLAAMAGGGNGAGYTVHDIQASDLTVSSGAWDTGAYPRSGDFSNSGDYFAASNTTDLIVFDAAAHTLAVRHNVNELLCGLNYYELTKVLVSDDDQYVFAKLDCGIDDEKSVLFYYRLP